MAISVPPIGEVASKWQRRAAGASQDLVTGIRRAAQRWQQATIEAAVAWFDGVSQANGRGAFQAGVNRAGNAKWLRKSEALAPSRYGSGVQAATGDYQQAFAPFLQVISTVDLPARGIRGSAGNYERSAAVGRALNAARIGVGT